MSKMEKVFARKYIAGHEQAHDKKRNEKSGVLSEARTGTFSSTSECITVEAKLCLVS